MTTRAARRARQKVLADQAEAQRQQSDAQQRRHASLPRILGFALVVVVILGAGTYLAASVFLGARGANAEGYLPVRLSMAGFDPKTIDAKVGETVKLNFWNTDNAMHLDGGGVHTFIMDSQKIYVTIPPEAQKQYAFTAPATPGDYDFYCNTCCGGKASPTMHGTLHVTA